MQKDRDRRYWRDVFRKHSTLIASVIMAANIPLFFLVDVALTSVYRAYLAPRLNRVNAATEYRSLDPQFHHGLLPMVSVPRASFGPLIYPLSTNSLGFRDFAPRKVPLVPRRHRILLVGDSFTEGVGVPYENTFAGILTKEFEKRNVEVLNAGVIKSSPIIYYRKIKHYIEDVGLSFHELIVFIDISDIYDEAVNFDFDEHGNVIDPSESPRAVARPSGVEKDVPEDIAAMLANHGRLDNRMDNPRLLGLSDFIKNRTTLTLMAARAIKRLIYGQRATYDVMNLQSLWTIDDRVYKAYGVKGVRLAQERMTLLSELMKKHGIPMTVVVYPWPDQVLAGDLRSRQVAIWQSWAAEHGAGFINLFPDFIANKDKDEVLSRFYIPRDAHFSAEGHAFVAQRVLEKYRGPARL